MTGDAAPVVPVAGPSHPAAALAVGGGVPAALAGLLLTGLAAAAAGPAGAAGAVLGTVVCGVAMLSVPGLMRISRGWVPEAALVAALGLYGLVLALGWTVFVVVAEAGWPSAQWTGVGVAVGLVAWSFGLIRAASRLRILLWDQEVTD